MAMKQLFLTLFYAGALLFPLTVQAAPLVVGISTSPGTIAPGGSSEIRWSAIQGNMPVSCTIQGDDGWRKSYTVTSTANHDGVETVSPKKQPRIGLIVLMPMAIKRVIAIRLWSVQYQRYT